MRDLIIRLNYYLVLFDNLWYYVYAYIDYFGVLCYNYKRTILWRRGDHMSIMNKIDGVLSSIENLKNPDNSPFAQDELDKLYFELSSIKKDLISAAGNFGEIISHIDDIISSKVFSPSQVDSLKIIKSELLEIYDAVSDEFWKGW